MAQPATQFALPIDALIAANLKVLEQGAQLLTRLDDASYTRLVKPLFEYGIGSHIRHCLDAYTSLLQGLETRLIDYDQRARNDRIACDRFYAQTHIATTMAKMAALLQWQPAWSALMLQARQDTPHWTVTSLERELQFLLSHTVHHYALIALMLRAQGLEPEQDFGIAPSTLQHWQQQGQPPQGQQQQGQPPQGQPTQGLAA